MRLLVIEDDLMIGRAVSQGLMKGGFAVDWVTDGRAGQLAAASGDYDLVVLDLSLPRLDGLALLRALRAQGDAVPVLITSARDAVPDRITGLDAGADDYLLKPFDLDELVARVRALLRRRAGETSNSMTVGPLTIDLTHRVVSHEGTPLNLTAKEFALLESLCSRPGAVLSRERLEASIYAWGDDIASNAVEVHLHHLRRKLAGLVEIRNIRGVGYRIFE